MGEERNVEDFKLDPRKIATAIPGVETNESIKLIGQVIENSERISSSLWGSAKQMRGGH